VRLRFAATGVEPALTGTAEDRDVATGLLTAAPSDGWPPAPGGVLTRDHALGAVAAVRLGLTDPVIDATSVLAWTADLAVSTRVADLRALAGDALAGAVLDWAAGRAGATGPALRHLLRAGEARDAVPLGLVAGLLAGEMTAETAQLAREALIRLEPRFGGAAPAGPALRVWATESAAVVAGMLQDPAARGNGLGLLARADELLAASRADALADGSDLLPTGLTRRLASLAAALRTAVGGPPPADPDLPWVPADALAEVERAWIQVATHRLADGDARTAAFHAAVRLARWLTGSSAVGSASLQALVARHGDNDAWVDSAVGDAAPGVSDPGLGAGLAAVLAAVRARRSAHDLSFAAALAAHTGDDPGLDLESGTHAGVRHLEDLLPRVVLPLARTAPLLLLVLDGMSAGVGTEVITSVLTRAGDGWAEALLAGQSRRAAALAVLPTLTEVSRASLLCGELRAGGQDVELRGYKSLANDYRLRGAVLFHKKPLDSSRLGFAVADDVAAAIADVTGQPLVTCVLNTIDDALDRSDPGGTEWGADAVRHLVHVLDRARNAGRIVVLTADHGHVVERRQGTQRAYPEISSGRSRAATGPVGEGEVLVAGPRVLRHDGRAVLAVDEQLRYGPLKAGYHGGGAPAEAVVPVAVLVPGAIPEDVASLHLAPPQEPTWWIDQVAATDPVVVAVSTPAAPPRRPAANYSRRRQEAAPTLFDEPTAEPAPDRQAVQRSPVPAAVLRSAAYEAQKKIAGRVSVTDDQVRGLLDALVAATGHRLVPAQAAAALAVSPVMLRGAILHVQRLLNVEGYPVLRVDADGSTVVLDEALVREQFGIRA
jgi:hypothetical protein